MDFRSVLVLLFVVGVVYAARVSGGSDAAIESYPMAMQVERSLLGILWELNCASVIVNRRYALSAAQCFSGIDYIFFSSRVRYGTAERGTGGETASIRRVILHPNFNEDTLDNDIALVHLSSDLDYNERTQPGIITAAGFQLPENIPVIMVGWGDTDSSTEAEVLQELTTVTMNREVCASRLEPDSESSESSESEESQEIISTQTPEFVTETSGEIISTQTPDFVTETSEEIIHTQSPDLSYGTDRRKVNPWNTQRSRELTENMMCLGDLVRTQGRAACDGDVGGPVIFRQSVGAQTTDIVVGIISWARGCRSSAQPTVATAITMFTEWIVDTAQ